MMKSLQSLLLLTLVVFLTVALEFVSAQSCDLSPCSPSVNCNGFGNENCRNTTNNMTYEGNTCFVASRCSSKAQENGDITLTLNGASPKTISNYILDIQTVVMSEYNKFCVNGNNFQLCCPGAETWPNRTTSATAMSSPSTEVPFIFSFGTAFSTSLGIRLRPNVSSQLCTATVKATTLAPTTTTTTTVASATTVKASASNATATIGTSSTSVTSGTSGTSTTSTPSGTATSTSTVTTVAATATTTASTATTTASTATTTASTATTTAFSNTTKAPGGRRRRDIPAEERGFEDNDAYNLDPPILSRTKRNVPITLPTTTLSTITSAINVTSIVQSVLSSKNITVTVSVSVVGASSDTSTAAPTAASTTLKKAASQIDAKYSVIIAALAAICNHLIL